MENRRNTAMKKRWDLLPPSPLSLPSSNTLSTAFPKYLPGHTTDRPERTPHCATESRASPCQQPQFSAGLWQNQESFSDGKLILFVSSNQAQWLVSAGKFDLLHFFVALYIFLKLIIKASREGWGNFHSTGPRTRFKTPSSCRVLKL